MNQFTTNSSMAFAGGEQQRNGLMTPEAEGLNELIQNTVASGLVFYDSAEVMDAHIGQGAATRYEAGPPPPVLPLEAATASNRSKLSDLHSEQIERMKQERINAELEAAFALEPYQRPTPTIAPAPEAPAMAEYVQPRLPIQPTRSLAVAAFEATMATRQTAAQPLPAATTNVTAPVKTRTNEPVVPDSAFITTRAVTGAPKLTFAVPPSVMQQRNNPTWS